MATKITVCNMPMTRAILRGNYYCMVIIVLYCVIVRAILWWVYSWGRSLRRFVYSNPRVKVYSWLSIMLYE